MLASGWGCRANNFMHLSSAPLLFQQNVATNNFRTWCKSCRKVAAYFIRSRRLLSGLGKGGVGEGLLAPRGVSLYPAASCPGEPTQTRLCDGKHSGPETRFQPKTQAVIQLSSPAFQDVLLLTQKVAFITGFLKPTAQKIRIYIKLNIGLGACLCHRRAHAARLHGAASAACKVPLVCGGILPQQTIPLKQPCDNQQLRGAARGKRVCHPSSSGKELSQGDGDTARTTPLRPVCPSILTPSLPFPEPPFNLPHRMFLN